MVNIMEGTIRIFCQYILLYDDKQQNANIP